MGGNTPNPSFPCSCRGKARCGEEDAIALAVELHADLILMDDRDGVAVARSKGFRVAGTLGILALAASHKLLNLPKPSTASSAPVFTISKKS